MNAPYGQKGIVQQLLSDGRINVNVGINEGYTALIVAAPYGHKDIVKQLLSDGRVDLNVANNEDPLL